jgi:hypothetical protein
VTGEIKKFVLTLWVMRHFLILPGAPRACVDFCDPTAVSRLKAKRLGWFEGARQNHQVRKAWISRMLFLSLKMPDSVVLMVWSW